MLSKHVASKRPAMIRSQGLPGKSANETLSLFQHASNSCYSV